MAAAPRAKPAATDITGRLTALEDAVQEIKDLPMKTLRWVGGLIVGAAITLLTQNFILHQENAQNTQQAVQTAVKAAAIVGKQQAGTQP